MTLLFAGLLAFLLSHWIPTSGLKNTITEKFGRAAYMGVVSVFSVLAIVLIVRGYRAAPVVEIWQPTGASQTVAAAIMLIACILIVASFVPSNIARRLRHPMLTGIVLWALAHILANGDAAGLMIFVVIGGYALFRRYTLAVKSPILSAPPLWRDALAVIGGAGLFVALYSYHTYYSGIALLPLLPQ